MSALDCWAVAMGLALGVAASVVFWGLRKGVL